MPFPAPFLTPGRNGSTTIPASGSPVLGLVFGLLLVVMSVFGAFRRKPSGKETKRAGATRSLTDSHGDVFTYSPKERLGVMLSFAVGLISSLLGIGGGIIHVPALVYLLGFPVHVATATSHFVLVISTLFGGISHIAFGNVQVLPAAVVAATAVIGAQIGAKLSRRVGGTGITRMLAVALFAVGVRLFLKALGIM
jgi:uncharacterized membrane protein YfcA